MRIEWRDEAKADAREALAYIAQDNLAAAYGVYGEIEQQVALLADFPKMGALRARERHTGIGHRPERLISWPIGSRATPCRF